MNNIIQFVMKHSYPILFAAIFARQIGLPVPGPLFLLATGALVAARKLGLVAALGLAVIACVLADWVWYEAGRQWGGRVLHFIHGLAPDPKAAERRSRKNFASHGTQLLMLAKFVPGLDAVTPPLAGTSGTSRLRFLALDTVGAVLYSAAYSGLGYVFSHDLDRAAAYAARVGTLLAGLVFVGLSIYAAPKLIRWCRLMRELQLARITPEEPKEKLEMSGPTATQRPGTKTMNPKYLLLVLTMFAVAAPGGLLAQQHALSGDPEAPLLTLDDAVSVALTNNRLVKNSGLEAQKYDFQVSTIRSRRLPQFQFSALSGTLFHSFDLTFPAGAFGIFPMIGPVPETESVIKTPARVTTFMVGSMAQPLTQQYKIGLGIRATELARDIAKEDVRAERQNIAAEVRSAYFELVSTQAAVEAAREAVRTLEEAQRVTVQHIAEKTVLRADALEVDARLAKSQYDLSVAENGLATEHEHLNQLLGRDLATPFRVASMPEEDSSVLTLESVRQQALQNRPEIREAHLKERQAEYGRRLAKAEYIPDLSAFVGYAEIQKLQVFPTNAGIAGFLLKWEPFDWGRRRNQVMEKVKTVEQARNGAKEAETQIEVEVGMKYRKWKEAALLLKASRAAREAAAEQFRVTGNKYQEQAALVKDLLQAQAQSSGTVFKYQQALSSYWSALAELREAMGEE